MQLAYLILAHSNPSQLEKLVTKLTHLNIDIYIHIDLKVPISNFEALANMQQVYFINNRVKVYWGAYSIVQATVNGFEQIINSGKAYQHIALVSGQCYPIKSNDSIIDFFKSHSQNAFMEFYSINDIWKEAIPRLNNYYLTNYPFIGSTKLEGIINRLLPAKKAPKNLVFVGRSQWFSITLQQAIYIVAVLKNNNNLRQFFKLSWGCDEFVFQTILYNSPFKNNMINDNLRYIDWAEGKASPKTFTIDDADTLLQSGKLYARKFDVNIDVNILDYIDATIV